jgi:hypothetical protein
VPPKRPQPSRSVKCGYVLFWLNLPRSPMPCTCSIFNKRVPLFAFGASGKFRNEKRASLLDPLDCIVGYGEIGPKAVLKHSADMSQNCVQPLRLNVFVRVSRRGPAKRSGLYCADFSPSVSAGIRNMRPSGRDFPFRAVRVRSFRAFGDLRSTGRGCEVYVSMRGESHRATWVGARGKAAGFIGSGAHLCA